ncbi:MAG: DUF433 domain-containing protein [Lewinellaceae bacterium]|nr:DUF433 domain-containing protein [Lewinellaceae bacterium]
MDNYQEYISIDPNIRFGKPCIKGTRIAVFKKLLQPILKIPKSKFQSTGFQYFTSAFPLPAGSRSKSPSAPAGGLFA